ncbi:MAG: hypothetical protein L6Q54_07760 [Leptospiraceae bacterium]|nr:hypothetical protein [Leptospiraceae bacterium]MCK6381129.1 hypothetical protein [Leptospiraceae bacterium]NUM40581.1 hypothetical protein [Leptospiraceae bacterium]
MEKIILMLAVILSLITVGCKKTVNATCSDSPKTLKMQNLKEFAVNCPANCGSASIWGTDSYTTDSSICLAAVHTGAIQKDKGGKVTVFIIAGLPAYTGSEKNGVTTSSWNSYEASFTVKNSDK